MINDSNVTKSLRERIDGLVKRAMVPCPDDVHDESECHLTRLEAVTLILIAVKEAMPEKRDVAGFYWSDKNAYPRGYNYAIEEMEKRCGLGTEPTNEKP